MTPRHADHHGNRADDEEGNAIGLTRAFSPVDDDGFGDTAAINPFEPFDERSDAGAGASDAFASPDELAGGEFAPEGLATVPPVAPEDAPELTGVDIDRARKGRHARHAKPEASAASVSAPTDKPTREEVPAYLHKSRRMRRILIGVIVVVLLLLAALGFFAFQLFNEAQNAASQQAQVTAQNADAIEDDEAKDASTVAVKKTTAPDLTALLGCTQDEAVEQLQHGAQVSSSSEVNEEGNPIKSEVRIALTTEPADTRSGTPTVYLGLDEEGAIIQAGYSASTSSLGYGSLSFADAVRNESIVEKTLAEAGVSVPAGTVVLPEDKMEYSTYASDGTTLVKEYCSFSGEVEIGGVAHAWSAVLSYDYAMANATGNLADTARAIYIYVNA